MKISIDTERSQTAALSPEAFAALLADTAAVLALFPKLRKLTDLGGGRFLLELKPMGSRVANIAHEVAFAAGFRVDAHRGELTWTPVPGQGNAAINGLLRFSGTGNGTHFSLRVHGELDAVPVPLLYRPVAPAFIRGKFTALLDIFLERLAEAAAQPRAAETKAARPSRARPRAA